MIHTNLSNTTTTMINITTSTQPTTAPTILEVLESAANVEEIHIRLACSNSTKGLNIT